jgi:AMP-polyphosphate phosphotransferase
MEFSGMTIDLSEFEKGAKFKGDFDKAVEALQKRLAELQALHIVHGCRTLIVVEGWDAAGKGGAIKRMTAYWDPRYFDVFPINAPTQEEKERHFLWRFWQKLPRKRSISVLDRSYYGRVLVERVEGYCSEAEWKRAFDEINEFEAQQKDNGTRVIKIFLHVTQEKQDKVLKERWETPSKQWKLTTDDFRNREKRADYLVAMEQMFDQTDTRWSPWKVIDGNDQKAARIQFLEHVIEQMAVHVPAEFPELDAEVDALAGALFAKP